MGPIAIPRPSAGDHAPGFTDEIALVPDAPDFGALLATQAEETVALLARFGESGAGVRYAPQKWTVRETVGHLADCERVLGYRALRLMRGDDTALPRFDAAAYVSAAGFEARPLAGVREEFLAVRRSTIALFEGARPDWLARRGRVGSGVITVAAIAYLIAGHERHHQALLRDRYLPLVPGPSGGAG